MRDVIFVAATVAFFLISIAYIRFMASAGNRLPLTSANGRRSGKGRRRFAQSRV